jgi:hypothetical protein
MRMDFIVSEKTLRGSPVEKISKNSFLSVSCAIIVALTCSSFSLADLATAKGKILISQGHSAPSCRMVLHQETSTGTQRWFRILDVAGHDDVSAVILAALVANKEVAIYYDPLVTTGCGSEPKISYVSIYP